MSTRSMQRFRRPSAPEKMMQVNADLGNPVNNQQSTSRMLYHALPLDGRTLFKFFDNVGVVTGITGETGLPYNNIDENNLQVKESLVIRRIRWEVLTVNAMTGAFVSVTDITTAAITQLYGGDWSMFFDTQQVSKPNPISSQMPQFSKNARHTTNQWIWLDNDAVIPTGIRFTFPLQVPAYTAVANSRLRMVCEGFGSLYSAKTQF